ncbi:MAG: tetratricopeptide repeat protein [Pseudomonadota bacterium]|nr:MAG: tetratricopeptide repeat protein [Pseudomonadota bacterium]
MVTRLAERMEKNPDDPTGWVMLGRSYLVMERYAEAVQAYAKAYALASDQPELLADYAEALSMAAGASMAGRPVELIREALRLDPENTKALWLAGIAAYQGERASAVAVWRRLASLLPRATMPAWSTMP